MDIPDRIQAIRDADPDFWRNPDALKAALMVWQPECHVNDHGIFSPCPREVVAMSGRAVAEVGVCRVREHCYVFCSGLETSTTGFGYAPSVWSAHPYDTEDAARRAGVQELLERTAEQKGHSAAEKAELSVIRARLREQVAQPTLF
ncbi:hypothetical protein [Zavarzinella formosa]|uniref:hypothetical protein n=1 Tax=Zavarzinella formosa TaxID=360055 RepID=UPI00031729BC|nr:hypothetical protein [Zavarzinella formosa]